MNRPGVNGDRANCLPVSAAVAVGDSAFNYDGRGMNPKMARVWDRAMTSAIVIWMRRIGADGRAHFL
ncbi:protein of unknown function [Candidatus Nitrospira inopinata]|uniref:Uncharacterized protein n=1 Tax=Candidatus Nitrospira inopinata TaxID=1715989 RepID=A0A0S4KTF5_9BACT|nr:protein of unknown function [Candidatus Nitrospira inopinata]